MLLAVNLLEGIMRNRYRTPFTSDYIFDEAVTVALYRTKDIRKAIDVGDLIVGNEERGMTRFINILSVSKSIALIKGREIDYIASFDKDFDGIVNRVAE